MIIFKNAPAFLILVMMFLSLPGAMSIRCLAGESDDPSTPPMDGSSSIGIPYSLFEQLPQEMQEYVLSFASPVALMKFYETSTTGKAMVSNDYVWEQIAEKADLRRIPGENFRLAFKRYVLEMVPLIRKLAFNEELSRINDQLEKLKQGTYDLSDLASCDVHGPVNCDLFGSVRFDILANHARQIKKRFTSLRKKLSRKERKKDLALEQERQCKLVFQEQLRQERISKLNHQREELRKVFEQAVKSNLKWAKKMKGKLETNGRYDTFLMPIDEFDLVPGDDFRSDTNPIAYLGPVQVVDYSDNEDDYSDSDLLRREPLQVNDEEDKNREEFYQGVQNGNSRAVKLAAKRINSSSWRFHRNYAPLTKEDLVKAIETGVEQDLAWAFGLKYEGLVRGTNGYEMDHERADAMLHAAKEKMARLGLSLSTETTEM
jgi:hypothetical protein